jgi:FtsH-binding integral membrane protein
MFIGHLGLAFAAKRATPSTSLATLLFATSFVDVLWPAFVIFGWESFRIIPGITAVTPFEFVSYPYSHSLLMGIIWGFVFGGIYWLLRRSRNRAARNASIVLGVLVLSHWVLDLIVHIPDLPLYPGDSIRLGLGLWNSTVWTILLESVIFFLGVWIYFSSTRPLDRSGRYGIWALLVILVVSYVGNIFGPPPPSVDAVTYVSFIGTAIMLLLAWWADHHRIPHLAP